MDLLRNLSLRMKLMLGFGFLNILIIVTSGFAVINTSKILMPPTTLREFWGNPTPA